MYRLGSLVPLIGSLFFLAYSYALGLGVWNKPGPGLWPFIISALMAVISLTLLVKEKGSATAEAFTAKSRMFLYAVGGIAGFIVLFQWLGFLLPGALLLLLWLKYLSRESWRMSVLLAVLVAISFYVVFVVWLKIPFPEDILVRIFQ